MVSSFPDARQRFERAVTGLVVVYDRRWILLASFQLRNPTAKVLALRIELLGLN
jgi:hypothetical protein